MANVHPSPVLPHTDVLRRNVIDRINQLSTQELAAVHDLILDVEIQNAWQTFSDGMTEDWAAGKYDQLDAAVKEAREKHRQPEGARCPFCLIDPCRL